MAKEEAACSGERPSEGCSFVWDDQTQLYFHASTGFYHDPNAGWYYSSRDGLYYKFENGNYMLFDPTMVSESQVESSGANVQDASIVKESCEKLAGDDCEYNFPVQGEGIERDEVEAAQCTEEIVHDESASGQTICLINQEPEDPVPPSQWLEDTLIDLYLSGYKLPPNATGDVMISSESNDGNNLNLSANGYSDTEELEEGEWIPEEDFDLNYMSEKESNEGHSRDEEIWQAQYGQVIKAPEEPVLEIPAVDLWDWKMVMGPRKSGKGQVARLVGRLVKRSAKLHPSMPSGGTILKTAPLCEASLNLVRVTTGQVYKLQNPGAKYLTSLSTYDSSNPTKDWGLPELTVTYQIPQVSKPSTKNISMEASEKIACMDSAKNLSDQLSAHAKLRSNAYRDRAKERRSLHGGFGIGPGQKSLLGEDGSGQLPESLSTEEVAAEALNRSFGAGSYARKILENMGWKEGETLGKTSEGLVEPIKAVGNIGNAGLGWPRGRTTQG